MQNEFDESLERAAGSKARTALRSSFRSVIKSVFERRSGEMEKSTVTTKYKDGLLDRLTLVSPHYSFKQHYGSTKTGTTMSYLRKGADVKSFQRHLDGAVRTVKAHERSGGHVKSHRKGIDYKAHNHIALALNRTNALKQLATDLGNSRAVLITSQIDF